MKYWRWKDILSIACIWVKVQSLQRSIEYTYRCHPSESVQIQDPDIMNYCSSLTYLVLSPHEGERARFVFNGLRWIQGSIRVWIPQPCDTTPPTFTKEFSIPVSTFVPQTIARQSRISFQFSLKTLEHSLAMELIDFCLAQNGNTLTPTC